MPSSTALHKRYKGTLLPLVFFTFFFFANAVLGYFSIVNVATDQEAVNLSRRNINLLNELHIEVLRAETGQRGYFLTKLDVYAAPYYQAMQAIDQRLINLSSTLLDTEQSNRFYQLQILVNEKVSELARSVELVEANLDDAAIESLLTHRGMALMQEIGNLTASMEQRERELLEVRLVEARDSRTTSFYLMLTANIVGLIMVFVTQALIRSHLRKEEQFLATLQEAKDNLEHKVEERTFVLQHYSNELRRSNRELQDFAFVASHDLQEPLRKIRAFGDRLQQNFAQLLGEQGSDYIQRMQNASARMSGLIEDLLSFSRITTRAKPFLPVALDKVVAEVLEDLEVAIDESKATITVGALPEIAADQFQMKQLFQNMLGNAIKFRNAGVSPVISVTAENIMPANGESYAEPEAVVIRIVDNGIGFDETFLDRIFLPFQRLHGRNEYSGTGIGLAVCRRIIERHGGNLTATSTPGKGSTFLITLPYKNHVIDVGEPV